jgi:type I restriction enzyme, S subunit
MAAVDAVSGKIATPDTRTFSVVRKGFTSFRDSDVIMAKITPCAENGKAAIASDLQNGLGFGSTEFHVLRPTNAVLAQYVYYFIRQESFREAAAAEMTGSIGQKGVPAWFLENASLPLPPVAEQRRIASKVEALVARVDAARHRLAKVSAILKRFRQSVLASACSRGLTADCREARTERWQTLNLAKTLREPMVNGRSVRDAQSGFPVLRLTALKAGRIDLRERKIGAWTSRGAENWIVRHGDFLIARGNGSLSLVGRGGLV